jgi:hypothetical protein
VRFQVTPGPERLRFQVRGRRGLNRMRFTGRIRGTALAGGAYTLTAVAVDRAGRTSAPSTLRFRIGRGADSSSGASAGSVVFGIGGKADSSSGASAGSVRFGIGGRMG